MSVMADVGLDCSSLVFMERVTRLAADLPLANRKVATGPYPSPNSPPDWKKRLRFCRIIITAQ